MILICYFFPFTNSLRINLFVMQKAPYLQHLTLNIQQVLMRILQGIKILLNREHFPWLATIVNTNKPELEGIALENNIVTTSFFFIFVIFILILIERLELPLDHLQILIKSSSHSKLCVNRHLLCSTFTLTNSLPLQCKDFKCLCQDL